MNHQTKYLVPSVNDVYKIEHENVIKSILEKQDEKGIVALGDGRADSPGHLAKYGTYTVMEKTTKKIIAAQFVQSNEVGSSTAMEKEGLKRSLEQLSAEGVNIAELVTYRHVSIRKMMRENHPEIRHSVDVWNVVKGELDKLIVQRGCKLIALGSHIINVHTHSDPLLTECQRGELKERKWFLPCKCFIIIMRLFMPAQQVQFQILLLSISSRYQIAILHFNENCNQKQARTKSGDERYNVKYPKYKKGSHTLCKVFEKTLALSFMLHLSLSESPFELLVVYSIVLCSVA
uniref:Uncharacterized protein n=1 Tax=Fundulus heteroclitus TaxID=8078 RepID=A0A3Q2QYA5_FUNHE